MKVGISKKGIIGAFLAVVFACVPADAASHRVKVQPGGGVSNASDGELTFRYRGVLRTIGKTVSYTEWDMYAGPYGGVRLYSQSLLDHYSAFLGGPEIVGTVDSIYGPIEYSWQPSVSDDMGWIWTQSYFEDEDGWYELWSGSTSSMKSRINSFVLPTSGETEDYSKWKKLGAQELAHFYLYEPSEPYQDFDDFDTRSASGDFEIVLTSSRSAEEAQDVEGQFLIVEQSKGPAAGSTQTIVRPLSHTFHFAAGQTHSDVLPVNETFTIPISSSVAQGEEFSASMSLVPIEVTKIWSDQFAGSDANQLPNKPSPSHVGSGAEKHKYILVGGRDPGQQVYIKAEVDFPDISYLKSKFKFALARMSGDIPFIKGPSAAIDENGELSLQTSQIDAVSYSNDEPEDYAIVGGYDENDNGLANSEVGYISKFRIRPVSFSAHDGNRTWLSAFVIGGWIYDRPFSAAFLQAFLTGSTISGVGGTVGDETMSINDEDEPDHHVGITFDASNSGPIRRYSWDRYSMLAYDVAGDQGITGMIGVRLASAAIKSEVQSYEWQANEIQKTFTWTLHPTQNVVLTSFANEDLHTAFGSAWLKNAHIKVTIDKNTLMATSVVVEGTLTDLYDWNYGEGYETDRRAATVQAGYNTFSPGGWIFRLQVNLDTPTTLPSPSYNFN